VVALPMKVTLRSGSCDVMSPRSSGRDARSVLS
jgi:hypothetical protein